ncbi:MAG: divergent polysaccharide deacetylase family protein [Rhodobacteraceae bacterium]|nr:divergent polysaccharide deacetylase family protein [Paracoccaceae bacterium]
MVGPPIEAFAATFEDSANRPLVGIVLIDEPGNRPSADSLMSLSFPLTFAVDATDSGAAEAMDYYRQAGHEVAVIVPLSAGAGPDGAEAAISGALETVPQAVAVMDIPSAEFQADRAVAGRIVEMMEASGRGFLTYARGFNSAQQIALRDNVPAALVFRDIDSDAQDQASIGRFLDQAAFRAGQADRVVLVGHSRPETIAAIVEWNLGNRAAMVALAPLSATLLAR